MIDYPYELINVEKKYELPNELVDEHNKYVGYKLTDYSTLTQVQKDELNYLTNLLYPYNICASDWNKFQEITENLQKFIRIDLVNYINESYFSFDDVKNEIDNHINVFKTNELITIIEREVKRMGNFYTYIRPSANNYHNITLTNQSNMNVEITTNRKPSEYKVWELYDLNLFGYGILETDILFSGDVVLTPNRNYTTSRVIYLNYSIDGRLSEFDADNSLETVPSISEFKNNFDKPNNLFSVNPITQKASFNKALINPGTDVTSGKAIVVNINERINAKILLKFSPSAKPTIVFSLLYGNSPSDFYGNVNFSNLSVTFSNSKIYREKFNPPINGLGEL